MNRRDLLKTAAGLSALSLLPLRAVAGANSPKTLRRIAFGSCCHQTKPMPLWNEIGKFEPELFVALGDNVYADSQVNNFHLAYESLAANPDYARFAAKVPFVATWDDHDMGGNDEGASYPLKAESKQAMLNFFREPADTLRRRQQGLYTSYFFGEAPMRLQIILMDLRWFRSPLQKDARGVYVPNYDPDATLLGEEQWAWLERELRRPADFRILGSSIQLVSQEHQWEKWGNFPLQKRRLYDLFDQCDTRNLLVISGDMHFGEHSRELTPSGREVVDITSSGINMGEEMDYVPNANRVAFFQRDNNFGLLDIDWERREVYVQVRDSARSRINHVFSL